MLLQRNATVYMLCRNKESTEAVIKEFKELKERWNKGINGAVRNWQ